MRQFGQCAVAEQVRGTPRSTEEVKEGTSTMSMSKDLIQFLNDVLLEKLELQGASMPPMDAILKQYPNLLPEEAAAIVARSDAQLIALGVPYNSKSCWFTCGISCAKTGGE
jgi:hypothetical protein